jgi:DNA invertase Pin-like site-specific DNA recombinase
MTVKWDVKLARELYDAGQSYTMIAKRVGIAKRTFIAYTEREGWKRDVLYKSATLPSLASLREP